MPEAPSNRAVLLTQFLNGIGFGLVFPVAAYYAESLLASATTITLMLAMHPLARLLSGPAWGRLADRFGRRPVLLTGIALAALGHLVMGFAFALPMLFVGRLLTGLGSGDAVAAAAIVADTTTGERRARGIGELRAVYGLGMLMGPLFGGVFALGGLAWPSRVAAVLCLLNLLIAARGVEETGGDGAGARLDLGLLALPGLIQALWIAFAASLALALAESIVSLAIKHVLVPHVVSPFPMEVDDQALAMTVGLIMIWGLSMAFVEGWLAGRLVPRFGERPLLVVGLATWAAAFVVTPTAYVSGLAACVVVLIATAAAAGLTSTALGSLVSRTVPHDAQGRGFGLYASAAAIGEFVGPASAGLLYERSFAWPYFVGTAVLVTALVAASTIQQENR